MRADFSPYVLLLVFWFLRTGKQLLFWLSLWQLKEYHIGRFRDHFRTAKGRQIFLNPLFGLKLLLLAGSSRFPLVLPPALFAIYFFETAKTLRDAALGFVKKPVFTFKALLLTGTVFSVAALTAIWVLLFFPSDALRIAFSLLLFDIFTPLIVSVIVLAFQPLAVLARRKMLERATRKRASLPKLVVVGITGSYGKTSTKEFLATILSRKFRVLKTREHQNSEVGVARCILDELRPEHEIFVCEMGAYGRGGIRLLCDIAKPKIGIITGVNEQHLALFGTMENLLSAEGGRELMEALPRDGAVIVNGDSKFISDLKSQISNLALERKIFYSVREKLDVWAENIKVEREHISFRGCARDGDCAEFRVHVLGAHFAPNMLAAAAAAKELGMTMGEIAGACTKITPEMTGMVMGEGMNGATIIDSTYSANPDGVISHLEYLSLWENRKIIIMPCLIELGKASREVHRRIGRKIGEVCDLAIVTTRERFRDIQRGAWETGMAREHLLCLEQPEAILEKLRTFVKADDIILLEGRIPRAVLNQLTSAPETSVPETSAPVTSPSKTSAPKGPFSGK